MKFTSSPGCIEFGVFVRDGHLVFFVKDSGIGIPSEKQAAVFERFQQVDASARRMHSGTGLGLTITRCLVELLGVCAFPYYPGVFFLLLISSPIVQGKIWLESTIGVGSTFFFSHPYEVPSEVKPPELRPPSRANNGEATSQIQPPPKRKLSIMLAEDNIINQKVTDTLLRKAGYDVVIAMDGKRAVEIFEEATLDCIFMDIQMPVMDGITATKIIREIEKTKNKKRTVIVALTANAMQGDMERYLTLGFGKEQFFLSRLRAFSF